MKKEKNKPEKELNPNIDDRRDILNDMKKSPPEISKIQYEKIKKDLEEQFHKTFNKKT